VALSCPLNARLLAAELFTDAELRGADPHFGAPSMMAVS